MNEKDVVLLYENGLTIREVAERCKLSYEAVRKILKSNNVKWRKKYLTDLLPEEVLEICKKFDENVSIKKIARDYKISAPAISRLLESFDRKPVAINRKYDIIRETPLNSIQKQFLVGTLLGDGCLHKDTKDGLFKLSFSHQKKHQQYFLWKKAIMDPFINQHRENVDKRNNSIMLQCATIGHQDFSQFANMFYLPNRTKIVPDNLDVYFTPMALATWIMDDGNLNSVNIRICSQGFSKEDNEKLVNYLKRCFDLNSKVMGFKMKGKQYWQITLNKNNSEKLSEIIKPYIVECMRYKIIPKPSTTICRNSSNEECDRV